MNKDKPVWPVKTAEEKTITPDKKAWLIRMIDSLKEDILKNPEEWHTCIVFNNCSVFHNNEPSPEEIKEMNEIVYVFTNKENYKYGE